jgi:hypothetical protein
MIDGAKGGSAREEKGTTRQRRANALAHRTCAWTLKVSLKGDLLRGMGEALIGKPDKMPLFPDGAGSDFATSRSTGKSGRRALVEPPFDFGVDDCRVLAPQEIIDTHIAEFAFFFPEAAIEAVLVPGGPHLPVLVRGEEPRF